MNTVPRRRQPRVNGRRLEADRLRQRERLHEPKPGKMVTIGDTSYFVRPDGSLRRIVEIAPQADAQRLIDLAKQRPS